MKIGQVLGAAGLAASVSLISHSAYAFDLNGAWATDVAACGKIFQKDKDGGLSIAKGSDMYGSGFIARKDAIVGNNATCKIVSQKVAGPVTHLVAQCASENVAFSTFQFSYRVKDDSDIVRIFPGIEELNVNYGRCKF
ncbi:MAG TPA: hypothetical protein VHQ92_14300 [Pseudolabrys sp.]|jgi:hypothetical protein|nr:hypothetical protein [Pseudolabrys sp.]